MTILATSSRPLALAALLLAAGVTWAGAAPPQAGRPRLLFPVIGPAAYGHDFGRPRPQGRHAGIDIAAPRRAVAVAVEAGTVRLWTRSPAAGCMLYLSGDSGTTYLYVHLNNDLGRGNDNRGRCVSGVAYASGLDDGDRVEAGQAVGLVGDSGDADGGQPHLHFEIHPGNGAAVDPFPFLQRAERLLFPVSSARTVSLALAGTLVRVGAAAITLRASLVRVFPSGAVALPRRRLILALPATAVVDAGRDGGSAPAASALTGQRVIVLTDPQPATLRAALGRPGALAVARLAPAPAGPP